MIVLASEKDTKRILVVDDEEGPRQSLKMIFSDDYNVTLAASGEEAVELAQNQPFDVVITDIRMRGISGIDVLREVKKVDRHTEVVILTAFETLDTARQAISLGASEYLKKPFNLDHIKKVVDRCYENYLSTSQQDYMLQSQLNAAKRNFLQIVSHELNTPVNGILGFIDLLSDTPLNTEQQQYVKTIRDCGIKCFEHFQDIQTYAKVTMSETELSYGYFNPATMIIQMVNELEHAAKIPLKYKLSQNLPQFVSGPEHEIRLVLIKIIHNALKFTQFGGVFVDLSSEQISDDSVFLKYRIVDSGPGIDPETLKSGKIFAPFTQADTSLSRPHEGLGLGLALCKTLCDRMGGKLEVESEVGKGTRFQFSVTVTTRN